MSEANSGVSEKLQERATRAGASASAAPAEPMSEANSA